MTDPRINFDDLQQLLTELESPILTKSTMHGANTIPPFVQQHSSPDQTNIDSTITTTTQQSDNNNNNNAVGGGVVTKLDLSNLQNNNNNNNHSSSSSESPVLKALSGSSDQISSRSVSEYGGSSSHGGSDSNPMTPTTPLMGRYMMQKEISLEQLRQISENSPLSKSNKYGRGNPIPRLQLLTEEDEEDEYDDDDDDDDSCSSSSESEEILVASSRGSTPSHEVLMKLINSANNHRNQIHKKQQLQQQLEELKQQLDLGANTSSNSLGNSSEISNNNSEEINGVPQQQQQQDGSGSVTPTTTTTTTTTTTNTTNTTNNASDNNSNDDGDHHGNGNNTSPPPMTPALMVLDMDRQLRKSGIRLSSNLGSPLISSRLPNQRAGSLRLKMMELNEEEYQLQQEFQEMERRESVNSAIHPDLTVSISIVDKLDQYAGEEEEEQTTTTNRLMISEDARQKSIRLDRLKGEVLSQLASLEIDPKTGESLVPITASLSESARKLREQAQEIKLNLPLPEDDKDQQTQSQTSSNPASPRKLSGGATTIKGPLGRVQTRPRGDSIADKWDIGSRRSQSLNMQRVEGEFMFQRTPVSPLKKPNQNMEKVLVHISLVDHSHKVLCVTEDFFVQDVIQSFAQKLGLVQTEFFSLSEPTPDGCDRWLDPSKLIKDAGIHNLSKLVFKIRFFKQPKKLTDSKAVHLYYLQIQQAVVQGIYPCSEAMSLRLAALQFYITFGAHDKDQHVAGFIDHATLEGFIPQEHFFDNSDEYIQRRLYRLHSQIKCNSVIEAKLRYLDLSNKIPTFGVTAFKVHDYVRVDSSSVRHQRTLCVAEDGLLISRKDRRGFDFFPFKGLSSWTVTSRGVQIQIPFIYVTPNSSELMIFDTTSNDQSNNIVDLLTGYKYFVQHEESLKGLCPPPQVDFSISSQFALFQPPRPRQKSDPLRSRLELFKSIYLTLCQNYRTKHILKFVDQIDELLDKEGSFRQKLLYSTIDLSSSSIRANDISFIGDALRDAFNTPIEEGETIVENLAITSIDLSNNPLMGGDLAEPLKIILETSPNIVHINLKNIGLAGKGIGNVVSILEKKKNIQTLHIGKNRLADIGVKSILKSLKQSTISTLGLEETAIFDEGCIIIQKLLQKNRTLTSLNISKNKITENGFKVMFEGLRNNQVLSELYLSGNPIGHKYINRFLQWISTNNNQLTKLAIASTSLNSNSGAEILKILTGNTCRLSVLDVSLNHLGPDGSKHVINGIANNNTILDVSLSGNKISTLGCNELCNSLELSASCIITKLSLRFCNLNSKSIYRICKMLETNKTITQLDLSLNKFSKSSCQALSQSLPSNTTLEEFFITNCEIGHKEFAAILPGLQMNSSIKKLYLDFNPIGNKGIRLLCDVINNNNSMEVITIRNAEIHAKEVLEFLKGLNTNITLHKLNLTENPIFGSRVNPAIKSKIEENLQRLARSNIQL
ncbi:hypothetical protein DFA_06178 [Cavenderia fasciculata]|uniref:FERM domain-containing protein n=1 Tax=Cavenderia fasciculata TaxID=261658 RepID=F4PKB6_CACFS|nr:uncharacterized protein DFA_06178 [Cavenderia fasciculata]EGG24040.1 hypothetical protein DFA_06178 [Cavenderia fasciculata]|eukprot:XP_004361891.1 hypothetical protein DFA_06178 [Cavenderia fasciculata]